MCWVISNYIRSRKAYFVIILFWLLNLAFGAYLVKYNSIYRIYLLQPLADAYGLLMHRNGQWEWTLAPGVSPSPRYQHAAVCERFLLFISYPFFYIYCILFHWDSFTCLSHYCFKKWHDLFMRNDVEINFSYSRNKACLCTCMWLLRPRW